MLKNCKVCGKEFNAGRATATCCSKQCAGKLNVNHRNIQCPYCENYCASDQMDFHKEICGKSPKVTEELRNMFKTYGRSLTARVYSEMRQDWMPSISTIIQSYGSWNTMLAAFGYAPNRTISVPKTPLDRKPSPQELATLERLRLESEATQAVMEQAVEEYWNYALPVAMVRRDGNSVVYTIR